MPVISAYDEKGISYTYSITENHGVNFFKLHCHDQFEIYFFIRGKGYYLIEGRRYELLPMSLAVIRPGEVHCFRSTGTSTYERHVINFSSAVLDADEREKKLLLAPFLDRELGIGNFYRILNDKGVTQIFNEFTYAQYLPEKERSITTRYLLDLLLAKILNISRQNEYRKNENYSSELVTQVIHYIHDHISEHITLDLIAAEFYISKYYLSRIFKNLTGVSVIEYLIRKRVFLSQQLLKEGIPPTEACVRSGFGDYSTFYRAFKRIVGCSPQNACDSRKKNGMICNQAEQKETPGL